jgi:SpoVK/Ycf46/Vps4 family AAA+-type ATPase
MKGVYDTFQNEQVELYIVDPKGECETGNKLKAMFMSYVPYISRSDVSNSNSPHNENLRERTIVVSSPKLTVSKLKEYIESICKNTTVAEASVTKMYVSTCEEIEGKNGTTSKAKWDSVHVKTNKRLSNTILSRKVEKELVADVKQFFDSESWYNSRGIPYKRGYILTGIPGSGKTSIIKSIAAEYNLPVFIIDFQVVVTNSEFSRLMKEISYHTSNAPYILALEDLDRSSIFEYSNKKISIQCLLNEIDGLVETHGRLLFITANDHTVFKEVEHNALMRPGRIDRTIEVGACDFDQIQRLLFHFFGLHEEIEQLKDEDMGGPYSPAQVIEIIQSHMDDESPENVIKKLFKVSAVDPENGNVAESNPVESVVPKPQTKEEKRYISVRQQLKNIQSDKRKIATEIKYLEKSINELPETEKKYQKKIQTFQEKLEKVNQKEERCHVNLQSSKEGLKKKKLKIPKLPTTPRYGRRRRRRRRR